MDADVRLLEQQTARALGVQLAGIEVHGNLSPGLLALLNRHNPDLARAAGSTDFQVVSVGSAPAAPVSQAPAGRGVDPKQVDPERARLQTGVVHARFLALLSQRGYLSSTPMIDMESGTAPTTRVMASRQDFSLIHFPVERLGLKSEKTDPVMLAWFALAHEAAHTERPFLENSFSMKSWTPEQNAAMNDVLFAPRWLTGTPAAHYEESFADAYGALMVIRLTTPKGQIIPETLTQTLGAFARFRANTVNPAGDPGTTGTPDPHDTRALALLEKEMKDPAFVRKVRDASPVDLRRLAVNVASEEMVRWLKTPEVASRGLDVARWNALTPAQEATNHLVTGQQKAEGALVNRFLGLVISRVNAYRLSGEYALPLDPPPASASPLARYVAGFDRVIGERYVAMVPVAERLRAEAGDPIGSLPHVAAWQTAIQHEILGTMPQSVIDAEWVWFSSRLATVTPALEANTSPWSAIVPDMDPVSVRNRIAAGRPETPVPGNAVKPAAP
jgi:hypothetical protein